MEFLSLNEPPERPGLNLGRSEALFASMGVHLLVLLLLLFGRGLAVRYLPETLVAFLAPARPQAAPATAPSPEERRAAAQPRIPIKFTYVSVPNDVASKRNPKAPLFSDKNRVARQEVRTPPDAKSFSIDPHSVGTSTERVKADPRKAKGREDAQTAAEQARGTQDAEGSGQGEGALAQNEVGRQTPPLPAGEGPGPRAAGETGASAVPRSAEEPGARGGPHGKSSDPSAADDMRRAVNGFKPGEYKFELNNPSYLRNGSYGTMSFDTQDFPWGDYARRIHQIIRNNWIDRLPVNTWGNGVRGWVCQHFVIEKDGRISSIDKVATSGIPPYDRAAADALNASTLPPLPESFPDPREGVTFCFFYNLSPEEAGFDDH